MRGCVKWKRKPGLDHKTRWSPGRFASQENPAPESGGGGGGGARPSGLRAALGGDGCGPQDLPWPDRGLPEASARLGRGEGARGPGPGEQGSGQLAWLLPCQQDFDHENTGFAFRSRERCEQRELYTVSVALLLCTLIQAVVPEVDDDVPPTHPAAASPQWEWSGMRGLLAVGLVCPWQLPTPIWEPRAGGTARCAPPGPRSARSPTPRGGLPRAEVSPGLLPTSHSPCRGSWWLRTPSVGITEPFLLQVGRTCGFWNSGLDKRSLLFVPHKAKGLAPGTGNWMLSGCPLPPPQVPGASQPALQLLLPLQLGSCRPKPGSFPGLSCGLSPGQPITIHPPPASRTQSRTGALMTFSSSRLALPRVTTGRAHVSVNEQFPNPQAPRGPGIPFPQP